MPLMMDGGRIPTRWAEARKLLPGLALDSSAAAEECLQIALVNNMPDPALEDTEMQFFELLDAASGNIPLCVSLYSLPEVLRGDRAQQHLNNFYLSTEALGNRRFHGVIITGTEPRRPDLREEPYWNALVNVFDWAERNTVSTVLSCLAAHASVLHSEGISRHPLSDKQFGVFDYRKACDHPLTSHTEDLIRNPHSRWNEVRQDALASSGYTILTQSAAAGVDLFVKKKRRSLFVHFQGHPEYGARTLLKEFRRDVRRFLARERETFPTMPHGYFDCAAQRLLDDFRQNALSNRNEALIENFPEAGIVGTLEKTWQPSATCIYRNWLQYLASN